jgi:demethylmenaquinone methyltransferase/2-methoxy-6-polyprenyl-1,4-benzoquinol methylase
MKTTGKDIPDPRIESWKMFDRIARGYDRANRILSLGADRSWRKRLARHLPEGKLALLDVATGTGDQLLALFGQKNIQIAQAFGVDLSQEMLHLAKEKLAHTPTKLLLASADQLPFSKNFFDAATISFGIRNVPSPLTALQELHRVLKPQGKALILEFSIPPFPIRPFHLFYLRHILPHVGRFLSRDPEAYRYLNQTIETFPYGKAFVNLMKQAGFSQLTVEPMMFGAVSLYVGVKG